MLRIDINLLFTVINLLVLFGLMYFLLFKPVRKIIAQRQEAVDQQFKEAEDAKASAQELEAKYQKSMDEIKEEKRQVLQDASRKADSDYHRIIDDAKTTAQQIKDDATLEGENQKKQILLKAEKEIADMVVDATAKVVAGNTSTEANASLYNKFLDKAGDK